MTQFNHYFGIILLLLVIKSINATIIKCDTWGLVQPNPTDRTRRNSKMRLGNFFGMGLDLVRVNIRTCSEFRSSLGKNS